MRELSAQLTEGENAAAIKRDIPFHPAVPSLSLHQKSKIFATSLSRGRHG